MKNYHRRTNRSPRSQHVRQVLRFNQQHLHGHNSFYSILLYVLSEVILFPNPTWTFIYMLSKQSPQQQHRSGVVMVITSLMAISTGLSGDKECKLFSWNLWGAEDHHHLVERACSFRKQWPPTSNQTIDQVPSIFTVCIRMHVAVESHSNHDSRMNFILLSRSFLDNIYFGTMFYLIRMYKFSFKNSYDRCLSI